MGDEKVENIFQPGKSATINAVSASELPREIVEEVLRIALLSGSLEERRNLLCLSKDLYSYLARAAYYLVQIHSSARLQEFLFWMDTKSTEFLRVTVKALHIHLGFSRVEKDTWTGLLARLEGLQMLYIFCSDWSSYDCLVAVWRAIFLLKELKSVRLDWHFNSASLAVPPANIIPYALQTVTHLTIVGDSTHSFGLEDISQFNVLSHLAIINPILGYSKGDILHWEKCLCGLHLMVILVFWSEDTFISGLDETLKIVGFVGVGDVSDEFRNHANGGETMWTRAEAILAERNRMRYELS
ncbi:hypothetical protein DL96DRAFT_1821249 [Flagelloscypha sp. PMI_526]|nr:hypothetical protein DL96DRAFT_1821249 [Flagelloscypha sp. PMI_526]